MTHPSPVLYYSETNTNKAVERNKFVGVHDISNENFDVILTDITDEILRTQIAEVVGIHYLKEAAREEAEMKVDIGHGPLWDVNARSFLNGQKEPTR